MDSSYYRYDGDTQPRPAGPHQLQLQVLQDQQQQQQQQHHVASPSQQQSITLAPLMGGGGARQYLVSPPLQPLCQEQQQQQQKLGGAPLIPFSVSYSEPPIGAPIGSRGWLAEVQFAAASALTALQQIKENPMRRLLLLVVLLSFVCFSLLHVTKQSQTAAASLTGPETHGGICKENYRENILKLAHEASAFSLLAGGWPQRKFEASDVVATNKSLYFVCDSSFALMKTGFALEPLAPENSLIGSPERNGKSESDWEALWLDEAGGVFYVIREAITHNPKEEEVEATPETEEQPRAQQDGARGGSTKPFHAHVEEIKVHGNTYSLQTTCKTDFSFSKGNKGFEGIVGFRNSHGKVYLLGLCEGNFCEGGDKGKSRGNGRMVLMAKETEGNKCHWKTIKVLELPSEIDFADYSSVTTRGNLIAIASQEDSMIWLGRLNIEELKSNSAKSPPSVVLEEPDKLEVLPGGKLLYFPRDDDCNVIYCNIEGIAFINDRMIAAASDKVKRWQEHRCLQKDQSLHVFSLPADV